MCPSGLSSIHGSMDRAHRGADISEDGESRVDDSKNLPAGVQRQLRQLFYAAEYDDIETLPKERAATPSAGALH
jgi:hypothetical protein